MLGSGVAFQASNDDAACTPSTWEAAGRSRSSQLYNELGASTDYKRPLLKKEMGDFPLIFALLKTTFKHKWNSISCLHTSLCEIKILLDCTILFRLRICDGGKNWTLMRGKITFYQTHACGHTGEKENGQSKCSIRRNLKIPMKRSHFLPLVLFCLGVMVLDQVHMHMYTEPGQHLSLNLELQMHKLGLTHRHTPCWLLHASWESNLGSPCPHISLAPSLLPRAYIRICACIETNFHITNSPPLLL